MAEAADELKDLYTIVVVGTMNPAIHHPLWYEAAHLIDQTERESAMESPGLVNSREISQFAAPGYSILCLPERWEIRTASADLLERLLVLACGVFDALPHTPVKAFGFNFHVNRPTSVGSVGKVLASALHNWPIGFQSMGDDAGEVRFISAAGARKCTVMVGQAEAIPSQAAVRINFHYDIKPNLENVLFDLTPLLREHFWADHEFAQERIRSIISGMPRMESVR